MTQHIFAALGNRERYAIVQLLHAKGEHSVADIMHHIGLTQSPTSQHLRILRDVGLLKVRTVAQSRFYSLNHDREINRRIWGLLT